MQFSITPLSEVLIIITSSKIIGIVENHSVSHSLPMSDAKVRVALKTEVRLGCKPFRTESSSNGFERIQPENLVTACHTLEEHPATETSDWREIRRKKRGTAYRRSWILTLRP